MTTPDIFRTKLERGAPVLDEGEDRLFPWWSVAKTVLAACVLRLVERGRLKLETPLPGRPYSLRQLLQHRAGLKCYGPLEDYHAAVARGDRPWLVKDLLDRVGADRLAYLPDKGWGYSNVGYLFVRQAIEGATGADIGASMRDLVFDPLGLRSVSLASVPEDLDGSAWGNAARYHPGWIYHGLLTGTAADAARFMDGLMTGRLLQPETLRTMRTAHPIGGPLPGHPWQTTGYGLGLMIGQWQGAGLALGHSGAGPGSVNAVYHFPDRDAPATVAVFSNAEDEAITERAIATLAGTGDTACR